MGIRMIRQRRTRIRDCPAWGLLLLSLCGGCQAVGTRASCDSYYEHDGMWCGSYAIGVAGARVAVLTALTELKMPVYHEGPYLSGLFIDTRTPDNSEARLMIVPLDRYDKSTSIGVRIGGFGTHREVCERLLGEIARHLHAVERYNSVPPAPVISTPTPRGEALPVPAARGPDASVAPTAP